MKLLKASKKGLHVAIMVLTVLSMSGVGGFIAPETAQASGSIWTTDSCSNGAQDANHYAAGEHVYVNGSGFQGNHTYSWYIKGNPGNSSGDPNIKVAQGSYKTSPNGTFCFDAYTVAGDDWGEYQVKFDNKGDNYRVKKVVEDTTIEAQKVICDAEEFLPNGNISNPITPDTAQNWVDQSQGHCRLAEDWDFKWWTNDTNKTLFSVSSPAVVPADEGTIKLQEVLPSEYIPFSNDNKDDYTAEFYCADDVTNYDNEEWIKDVEEGETYNCVAFNAPKPFCGDGMINQTSEQCDGEDGDLGEHQICNQSCQIETLPYCGDQQVNQESEQCDGEAGCTNQCTWDTATLTAQKVVCDVEYDAAHPNWGLPNWGNGGPNITSSTAQGWVDNSEGHCKLVDWDFQWAPNGTLNPGDNIVGEAGAPWTTFSGTVDVPAFTDKVWVREVWNDKYIPFTFNQTKPSGNANNVSAELYCNNDVLNYDNYDWITNFQPGEDYYCVGWNVSNEGTVTFHKDVRWNNDKVDIDDNESFGVKINGELKGNVSENSPLVVTLQAGDYSAEEDNDSFPAGYEGIVSSVDFTVERNKNVDVYFTNKTMCVPGEGWAYGVVEANQGTKKNNQPITDPMRTNPMDAVGPASPLTNGDDFFALGKGGSITLAFEGTVKDVEGVDLSFHEETWNNRKTYGEEKAEVFVSYNGSDWFSIGEVRNESLSDDGTVDGVQYLDIASAGLPVIKYVKLVDTTDYTQNTLPNDADGYDLDAIDVTYGYCKDVAPSYIQGKKFNDFNYNGKKDNGDYFMDDWTINLYKEVSESEWTFVKTMDTGVDTTEAGNVALGQYRFTNLYPGTYFVCEIQKDGWYETRPNNNITNISENSDVEAPNCFKVTISDNGQKRTGRQFGNAELLSIAGFKWHDVNGDGIRNCATQVRENLDFQSASIEELPEPILCEEYTEGLLPNWTIFIDENANGILDEEEQSTETDETGMYAFEGLQAGTYRVCEVNQKGWEQTYPLNAELNNCHDVIVPQEQEELTEYNFGNRTVGDPIIEKTAVINGGDVEVAEIGDRITYTITVTNNYDTDIPDLLVEDTLPSDLTLVPGSFSGDYTPSNISGDTYQWGTFTLPGNSSVSMSFDATVNDDIAEDTTIDNIAILYRQVAVEDVETDVSFFNQLFGIKTAHAATFELVYIAQADVTVDVNIPEDTTPSTPGIVKGETTKPVLEIIKTVDVEFANPGDTVTYTVVVKNIGDGQALGVSVTDTLPNGFTFADGSGTTKTWFLGALDVDAQKSIVYDVIIGNVEAGQYKNVAVASADNADSTQATATLDVREPAVLGDSVPSTGITFRDYAIFISSLLLIAAGSLFIYRGRAYASTK